MADTEYLDEERKKTWERIKNLEEALPAIQKLAEEAKKIAENKIGATEEEATKAFEKAKFLAQQTSEKQEESIQLLDELKDIIKDYKENRTKVKGAIKVASEINEKSCQLAKEEENISEIQNKIKLLQTEVSAELSVTKAAKENITAIEAEVNSSLKKITDLQTTAKERKSEIDDLYNEIMGDEKPDGEREGGLKDKLNKSYSVIEEKMKKFSESFENLKRTYDSEYENRKEKLDELMPEAMAKGLSAAYVSQKKSEISHRRVSSIVFTLAIISMVLVSLIPVYINFSLHIEGVKKIQDLIENFPKTLFLVIPIYFPLLWIAWTSNKSINLSKRLIEEYAHKEVLSKTYLGLVKQIQDLPQENMSHELRAKLLFNMIITSAENPGKLITDYNKTDNPLMEIMDKTAAVANAVDKFKNIPGISQFAKYLNKKAEEAEREFLTKATSEIDDEEKE